MISISSVQPLQTDGGGVAIVTLTTADAAATDPVRAGDKIEIRKIGQQRFDTTGDPTAIDADGFMVIRLLAVPADWEEGQVVHLELMKLAAECAVPRIRES